LKPTFPFQRLKNLAKSRRIEERKNEEERLKALGLATFPHFTPLVSANANHLLYGGNLDNFITVP